MNRFQILNNCLHFGESSHPLLMNRGIFLACLAGLFGSLASSCGKFALDSTALVSLLNTQRIGHLVIPLLRLSNFALIFLFNSFMWNAFSKALELLTSLEATILNTASNFILTAFLGIVLFGDKISILWCFGASMILTGIFLITYSGKNKKNHNEKTE